MHSMRSRSHGWLLAVAMIGCGAASFRGGVYQDEHVRYRVGDLPATWRRVSVDDCDLAFVHRGAGTISVNSTCTDYEDVPATALMNHLFFDTTEREHAVDEVVTLDGRGARHAVVRFELDGVPLEAEIFVLAKDGCVFDLSHIRGTDVDAGQRAVFSDFVSRFAVTRVTLDD